MPSIVNRKPSLPAASADYDGVVAVQLDKIGNDFQSNPLSTPQKRTLRSNSTPVKWKSPRRSANASPNSPANGIERDVDDRLQKISKSPVKKLADNFAAKPNWNPRDAEQMRAVKEALHLSTSPPVVVCREEEQNKVLEFCKLCIKQEKAGSLYMCGCPGTGKTLSTGNVRRLLVDWAGENGLQQPDLLVLNCTSLTNTSDIFSKILSKSQSQKRSTGTTSPLKLLQNIYSQKPQESSRKMTMIIADELDYLITKDRAVLHDLFMLTTLPFSRCVLIGVANAIDLADRFLPKLKSLNCKPMVITFRAYSKDQILKILEERLVSLPYVVFQKIALELCARKVAAESGDMRKALSVCRSAIEMLEAELRESPNYPKLSPVEKAVIGQLTAPAPDVLEKREIDIVRIDHMVAALSKTYRSPVVDTIQSLPQHQQIILCSAVKLFRGGKKDTTIGELNKCYTDICKSTLIPPVGVLELSSMCKVLNDQGLLKLGQSREEKFKRVALKIDEEDVTFALQGCRDQGYRKKRPHSRSVTELKL